MMIALLKVKLLTETTVVNDINNRRNKMKKFDKESFWWSIHNLIGHPVGEILYLLGFTKLSALVHDKTMPDCNVVTKI